MTPEIAAELDALSAQFIDRDYDDLEARLRLKAAACNWTGDPMKQPAEVVLAAAKSVLDDRIASHKVETLKYHPDAYANKRGSTWAVWNDLNPVTCDLLGMGSNEAEAWHQAALNAARRA